VNERLNEEDHFVKNMQNTVKKTCVVGCKKVTLVEYGDYLFEFFHDLVTWDEKIMGLMKYKRGFCCETWK